MTFQDVELYTFKQNKINKKYVFWSNNCHFKQSFKGIKGLDVPPAISVCREPLSQKHHGKSFDFTHCQCVALIPSVPKQDFKKCTDLEAAHNLKPFMIAPSLCLICLMLLQKMFLNILTPSNLVYNIQYLSEANSFWQEC